MLILCQKPIADFEPKTSCLLRGKPAAAFEQACIELPQFHSITDHDHFSNEQLLLQTRTYTCFKDAFESVPLSTRDASNSERSESQSAHQTTATDLGVHAKTVFNSSHQVTSLNFITTIMRGRL